MAEQEANHGEAACRREKSLVPCVTLTTLTPRCVSCAGPDPGGLEGSGGWVWFNPPSIII